MLQKCQDWLNDTKAVTDYLLSFNIFEHAPEEGLHYINYSLKRWQITLDMIPPAAPDGKLLEIGSAPYFMTLLLKKCFDYEIHGVNFTNDEAQPRGHYTYTAESKALGEKHVFPYDYFNGEIERFPYPDHRFDVVILCEVIEHLTLDPSYMVAECHRILKPGGKLIVTTPNILRLENLYHLVVGSPISDQYSGYGTSGRHNREFTPQEILRLLQACGYTDVHVKILDQLHHEGIAKLVRRFRTHWCDNIFAIGTAEGRPRYSYPDWLYRSMHAYHKVVSPLIIVGENDAIQMTEGWYSRERVEGGFARWSQQKAIAYLRGFPGARRVVAQVCSHNQFLGPIDFSIDVNGQTQTFHVPDDQWHELEVPLLASVNDGDEVVVMFTVDHVRVPAQLIGTPDTRSLGLLVKRIELQ